MSGIYIHVPFCATKCNYCNFFSVTSLSRKHDYVTALLAEIELQQRFFENGGSGTNDQVNTIYFGGGTPSLLAAPELEKVMQRLRHTFLFSNDPELTLEANPDDITIEKLSEWGSLGFNRLSIGVQSFSDDVLKYLTRRHSSAKSLQAIRLALETGFLNLSGDLIYGVPGMSDASLVEDVNCMVDAGINHISAYALTVEPRTVLDHQIRKGLMVLPDDDAARRQFYLVRDVLLAHGFEHYEISNFARPGRRSRHNSSYWNRSKYLGFGPSAHSFDGVSRFWNPSSLHAWMDGCHSEAVGVERETLTTAQIFNELLLTRLRTSDGLALEMVERLAGLHLAAYLKVQLQEAVLQGDVMVNDGIVTLPAHKLFVSDAIISSLMYVE